MPIKPRPIHNTTLQQRLTEKIEQFMLQLGTRHFDELKGLEKAARGNTVHTDLDMLIRNRMTRAALEAVRVLLGEDFKPAEASLPGEDEVPKWSERHERGEDEENPINFLERHWGELMNVGALDQHSLGRLDNSLLEAVRIFCRNRKMEPKAYLPPPARQQTKAHAHII
jgi:hypothetical protein